MSLKGRPSAVTSATLVVGRTILAVVFGGTANSRWSWPPTRRHANAPEATQMGLQRRAAIDHMERLIGGHAPRVPHIGRLGLEALHGCGDLHLVGALVEVTSPVGCGIEDPAQPGGGDIDAQRVGQVLAGQRSPGSRRVA